MDTKVIATEPIHEDNVNTLEKLAFNYISKNFLKRVSASTSTHRKVDPNTKNLLSYLFTGTRGGPNRLRVVLLLAERPLNAHQIAKALYLDYNAIEHHVSILEKNNLISRTGPRYGALFFLSTFLEVNIESFNDIVGKFYKDSN
jgi:DNA-binding transcriptional ArsR family regulator